MKKTLAMLLALVMLFSLCACGNDDSKTTDPSDSSQSTTSSTENSTGNTETPTDSTEGTTGATQAPTEEPTTPPTDEPTTPPTQEPTETPTTPPTTPPTTCNHSWKDATCTAPKTCSKCGATEGSVAGHSWNSATCTAPKTCSKCGATEGSVAGHSWNSATCTAPKTCSKCGATEGSAAGHSWNSATCTAPKTCSKCGATEGSVAGHSWNSATCTAPKTCTKCGATEGSAAGHSWEDATCTAPKTCQACGVTEGIAMDHNWKEEPAGSQKPNCLHEGFTYYECTACKEIRIEQLGFGDHTYGEWRVWEAPTCTKEGQEYRECIYTACRHKEYRPLEATTKHSWNNATCTAPKTCKTCGATEGSATGHSWGEWVASSYRRNPCTEDGIERRTCKNCYAQEEQVIKAAHSYEDGYCTRCDARDANYAFVYIDFKDKLFEAYVKQALGFEAEDKVATVDMKKLTSFTIEGRVTDVEELKYATNLKSITITASNVQNLDVLSDLPITVVHLGYNGGTTEIDVSFMKNLREATQVYFYDCILTGGSMEDVVSSPKLTYYKCFVNYTRYEVSHSIDYLTKAKNVTELCLWNVFSDTDISVLLNLSKLKNVEIYGRIGHDLTEQHYAVIDQLIINGVVVNIE